MSSNGRRSSSQQCTTPKASELDLEEASTKTFQNVEAKINSAAASWRNDNKPTADALDDLEQAVHGNSDRMSCASTATTAITDNLRSPLTTTKARVSTNRKKLLMSDVVRHVIQKNEQGKNGGGAGLLVFSSDSHAAASDGGGGGDNSSLRRSASTPGIPPPSRRSLYAPQNRNVPKVNEAQDLLKAARDGGGHEQQTATMIHLGDVFSDNAFHEGDDTARHSNVASENNEGPVKDTPRDEMAPLLPPTPSYGSNGASSGGRKPLPLRATVKQERRKFSICGSLCWILCNSYIIRFSLPLAAVAWVLFYGFGNPNLDVLPDQNPSIAWWCNFAVRQIATLEMSRILQYLVVDCLFFQTRACKLFGPLVTLIAIQAKGWPLVLFFWGLIDLTILHGDDDFQCNWFHWTGYKIYTIPGSVHVLNSPEYLQVLLCLVIAGAMTVVKRVYVGIIFGRRQYTTFAARLDTILADVVLLNEIATLAANAEEIRHQVVDSRVIHQKAKTNRGLAQVKWSSIRKDSSKNNVFDNTCDDDNDDLDEDDDDDDEDGDDIHDENENADAASEHGSAKSFGTSSGNFPMKVLLSPWQEPETNSVNGHILDFALLSDTTGVAPSQFV
jgi:hypothetical protein